MAAGWYTETSYVLISFVTVALVHACILTTSDVAPGGMARYVWESLA